MNLTQGFSINKVYLILLLIVLLPALFFSAYEINSLTASEELFGGIYRQQLDVVLFSLNQHAWDVASTWASAINILSNEHRTDSEAGLGKAIRQYLSKSPSIRAVFFADSLGKRLMLFAREAEEGAPASRKEELLKSLRANKEKIDRLGRYRRADYRKLEPFVVGDSSAANQQLALVFAAGDNAGVWSVAGVLLDERTFIQNVLAPKILETAGNEFVLAVTKRGIAQPVFATAAVQPGELKQRKELWLFPDHVVGIRLKGETIDDLVRSRSYRNLWLIVLLDVVLLAGVWIVYRSIRREMDLVRMKSDFVSNVSHELRTPLSLIRMYTETLEMGRIASDERKKEYYSTILGETERLSRLVNNILDFSRMEAGKKQFQFRELDVNTVVSNVVKTYAFQMQSEGITPVLDLDRTVPPVVADQEAVSQAVINLLDNAIKYGGSQKYLKLTTGMEDGFAFIEVTDRGIGIAPEHQAKIFDTFYRVSSGLVHTAKGSGLGLTLVQRIMQAHGGNTRVRSAPGTGSSFRLSFPLRAR